MHYIHHKFDKIEPHKNLYYLKNYLYIDSFYY